MQVLMLYYGRIFIQRGEMTTGNLVSFILYQSDLGNNIRVPQNPLQIVFRQSCLHLQLVSFKPHPVVGFHNALSTANTLTLHSPALQLLFHHIRTKQGSHVTQTSQLTGDAASGRIMITNSKNGKIAKPLQRNGLTKCLLVNIAISPPSQCDYMLA